MTLSIELTPAEQERVNLAAQRSGMDASEFVKRLLTAQWPVTAGADDQREIDRNHFYFTASRQEFNDALSEIAQMNTHLPVLADGAFDRESLYDDRL